MVLDAALNVCNARLHLTCFDLMHVFVRTFKLRFLEITQNKLSLYAGKPQNYSFYAITTLDSVDKV